MCAARLPPARCPNPKSNAHNSANPNSHPLFSSHLALTPPVFHSWHILCVPRQSRYYLQGVRESLRVPLFFHFIRPLSVLNVRYVRFSRLNDRFTDRTEFVLRKDKFHSCSRIILIKSDEHEFRRGWNNDSLYSCVSFRLNGSRVNVRIVKN